MKKHPTYFVPSTWKRWLARGLDQVFIWMVLAPLLMSLPHTEDGWIQLTIPWALALFLFPVFYEAGSNYFFYTSPGKWIFNLRILPASAEGARHWAIHVLIRALICYFGNFFWAIFAVAFFRYDRRHLADWMAETRVVGLQPTILPSVRPVLGSIAVILGLIQGWVSALEQIHSVQYENGSFYVPDPANFDFVEVDED